MKQAASVPGPRDSQNILTPRWLTRKVGWNVVGSRSLRPSQKPQCRGRASALTVEQSEMARAREILMTKPQLWTHKGKKQTLILEQW